MNPADYAVIAIMLVCGIIGLIGGFVRTIFRLASFFIALVIAVSFYPNLANYINQNTSMHNTIKTIIEQRISSTGKASDLSQNDELDSAKQDESDLTNYSELQQSGNYKGLMMLTKFSLPFKFKELLENASVQASTETEALQNYRSKNDAKEVADSFATLIINILSAIIIFVMVSIVLAVIRAIFEWIAELPVFYQLNKAGGFILGSLEGVLIVYFVCAIITLFATSEHFKGVFEVIDASLYAKHLYYNNFLLSWILSSNIM